MGDDLCAPVGRESAPPATVCRLHEPGKGGFAVDGAVVDIHQVSVPTKSQAHTPPVSANDAPQAVEVLVVAAGKFLRLVYDKGHGKAEPAQAGEGGGDVAAHKGAEFGELGAAAPCPCSSLTSAIVSRMAAAASAARSGRVLRAVPAVLEVAGTLLTAGTSPVPSRQSSEGAGKPPAREL